MKKKLLISILTITICFTLVGCDKNENSKINENNNQNNKEDDNNNSINNISTNDSIPISEIKGLYNNDLPLGLENNYLKVNGNDIVIRVQTSGSSEQQNNGPYYIYYNVYVGNDTIGLNCVRDAIYHLEGSGIEMLKTFDEENDAGVNYEFFEWDFTSSVHKGIDKEYALISLPAGKEDKNQASLMITTDDGKLLGEIINDVFHDTELTGPDTDKYKNHSGDIVFSSIKDGNITYLTPNSSMYIVENGKKVLNPSLDIIELEEHSVTMDNNKVIDTITNNVYQITNANGKTFNFGEFRHL